MSDLLLFRGTQPVPPPVNTLPRLVANGSFFEQETGERFTAIECSDFNLLAKFVTGVAEPIIRQRADCGFNMVRVFTLYDIPGIGRLIPCPYDQIPAFCKKLASYGLYVEFVAYTSTEDTEHWLKLTDAVRDEPNVLVELVNEYNHPSGVNHIDLSRYQKANGVLCAHGSNCAENIPVRPWWDYETWHTNGADEEQRKVGKQAYDCSEGAEDVEASQVPVITNETSRYPDVGIWVGAGKERQLQLASDAAMGAALLCAGSCFHSVQGKESTLWDTETFDIATAWTTGARMLSTACQVGPYRHRLDLEQQDPALLRAYERNVPGLYCLALIDK